MKHILHLLCLNESKNEGGLTFIALADNSTISITKTGQINADLMYNVSFGNGTWETYNFDTQIQLNKRRLDLV